jgi:hypothetical protein
MSLSISHNLQVYVLMILSIHTSGTTVQRQFCPIIHLAVRRKRFLYVFQSKQKASRVQYLYAMPVWLGMADA